MAEDLENPPLVQLRAAGRRVGERWLFRDLTVSLRVGDFICLRGANGSGKSVLLRCLCGLEQLDEGELFSGGEAVADGQMPRFRRRVMYVAQRPHLLGATLRESLAEASSFRCAHFGDLGEFGDSSSSDQLDEVLASVDRTADFADLQAERMSGGELLLAALAQAITLAPDALLLDEPTAALDDTTRMLVERRVSAWLQASPKRAVAWVTHDVAQANRLANQSWALAQGRLTVSPASPASPASPGTEAH